MDDTSVEKRLEALGRVVLATREMAAGHDAILQGDGRRAGLPALVAEARGAVLDLTREYREDRENAVAYYRSTIEPELRDLRLGMRRMFMIACTLALVSAGLAATVLVQLSGGAGRPKGALVADGR